MELVEEVEGVTKVEEFVMMEVKEELEEVRS